MLFYCSPSVRELNQKRCVIRIPLNRRTRNHLRSMYFGTLCVGADCAAGYAAMRAIHERQAKVALVFKDFRAEFLKRADGDVDFTCEQGEEVQALVEKAISTDERVDLPVHITATVPSKHGAEPVARFVLTLSLKRKPKK